MKVIIKLNIPWINFIKLYIPREILYLLTKEEIWAIIDRPENAQIKLIELSFIGIDKEELIKILQPLVYSIDPKKTPYIEEVGRLKKFSMLLIIMLT